MNVVEQKNTKSGRGDWENELWSLIDNNNGVSCALQETCQCESNTDICANRNKDYSDALLKYLDSDILTPSPSTEFPKFPECPVNDKIYLLVAKLANKWSKQSCFSSFPVPVKVILDICPDQPVEVRLLSLKSAHGAVWRLSDAWVIHLNSNDSPARRRFTLYHEVFHIIAYCSGIIMSKKGRDSHNGDFNEMLADFFADKMILPYATMRKKWQKIQNVKEMAVVFDVPETVMYCGLKWYNLMK